MLWPMGWWVLDRQEELVGLWWRGGREDVGAVLSGVLFGLMALVALLVAWVAVLMGPR